VAEEPVLPNVATTTTIRNTWAGLQRHAAGWYGCAHVPTSRTSHRNDRVLRLLLAATHLLALGIGLGAVWARSRALRGIIDNAALRRAFAADAWWGVAAVLWLGTGLTRIFAATEKSVDYYMRNPLFHVKMGLFVLILALEIWPMVTLIRWRRALGRNQSATFGSARRIARISVIEAFIVVLIVVVAAALARGYALGGS
jgi:putative membrane protein